jgi:hypothetical protein
MPPVCVGLVGWLAGWLLDKLAFFNHLYHTKKLTEQLKEIKIKESSKIGSLILEWNRIE